MPNRGAGRLVHSMTRRRFAAGLPIHIGMTTFGSGTAGASQTSTAHVVVLPAGLAMKSVAVAQLAAWVLLDSGDAPSAAACLRLRARLQDALTDDPHAAVPVLRTALDDAVALLRTAAQYLVDARDDDHEAHDSALRRHAIRKLRRQAFDLHCQLSAVPTPR